MLYFVYIILYLVFFFVFSIFITSTTINIIVFIITIIMGNGVMRKVLMWWDIERLYWMYSFPTICPSEQHLRIKIVVKQQNIAAPKHPRKDKTFCQKYWHSIIAFRREETTSFHSWILNMASTFKFKTKEWLCSFISAEFQSDAAFIFHFASSANAAKLYRKQGGLGTGVRSDWQN